MNIETSEVWGII